MKKLSIASVLQSLQNTVKRFPFVVFSVLGLASLFYLRLNESEVELKPAMWIFFSLSIFLQLAITLWTEQIENKLIRVAVNLTGILVMVVYVMFIPEKLLPYQEPQHFIIGLMFALLCFVVSFFKNNQDDEFWVFSKKTIIQIVVSYAFAGILLGGLALAVYSLEMLFSIKIDGDVYENLSITCMLIFGPVYLLANVPEKEEKYSTDFDFNKILKIFGLYILLPVLMLYTLILYVYLIQIVVKWELPDGWVSTLVSVLALGGFLCLMIVSPLIKTEGNKVVKFLSRYFPLLLLPLLILMTIGIIRRVDDYGYTINRLYVLILNIWFYGIVIYLLLTRSRHLKWIVISLVLTGLVFSIGPVGVYQINRSMMMNELETLLQDAKLLKDKKIQLTENYKSPLTDEQNARIYDLITYLKRNYSAQIFQVFYAEGLKDEELGKLQSKFFNIDYLQKKSGDNDKEINHYKHMDYKDKYFDTAGYAHMMELSGFKNDKDVLFENDSIKITITNQLLSIEKPGDDLKIQMQPIMKKYSVFSNDDPVSKSNCTFTGQGYKLIITNINFEQTVDKKIPFNFKNLNGVIFFN
jgi:hypothetical protein